MRRVLWFCRLYALNDAGEMGVDSDVQNSAGGLSGTFWRGQHGYAEDVTGIKKTAVFPKLRAAGRGFLPHGAHTCFPF